MKKKTILFVDDEPNILSALKRMLRSMRKEMDFHFAESGAEALALVEEVAPDVIVSDMRMPGMDGATLLTSIKEHHPHITRIMLTGQADEESIMRTVDVVHQFLAKPSNPDTLREVLTRACALHEVMQNDALKSLVASLGSLPSLPEIYQELQQKLKEPECSIGDVSAIIEKDLSMSAKVLHLVNSAFFGLYKNIDTPSRAVNLLGLDTIKALVLGIGVFSEMKSPPSKIFSINSLWTHCITTATYAKSIAKMETDNKEDIDNAFIGGMIHDIGKLLLFATLREQYEQSVAKAQDEQAFLFETEKMVFNADHSDVGAYLIGLWGLPGSVVEAIAFHHRLDEYPVPSFCPALAVHAADVIYYMLHPDEHVGEPPKLNTTYMEQAGMGDKFQSWLACCKDIEK